MPRSAFLMIVEVGMPGVALVLQDGHATLPRLDDWHGDSDTLAARLDQGGPDVAGQSGEPWRPLLPMLTVLASLAQHTSGAEGEDGQADLYLCEPGLDATLAGLPLAWWTTADEDPPGVPPALITALRSTYAVVIEAETPVEEGVHWPRYCLPGATRAIATVLAADPAASALATMRSAGATARGTDVRQLRGWCLSSVWRNDDVVLKATHQHWQGEPTINRLLNRQAPHLVEEVVASGSLSSDGLDHTLWMLQRRARPRRQEASATDASDPGRRRQSLRLRTVEALAGLQLALAGRSQELVDAGAEDRTVGTVLAELPALWESQELTINLERAEREALPQLTEHLHRRLSEVADLGCPPLLAHGDLHLGNVIDAEDGGIRFIDWTDAAVSWVGVDLLGLLPRASEVEEREAVISAYEAALGQEYAPAVRPGLEVATLFHALSYAKIDAFLPPSARWHFFGTTTNMVRRLLTAVMQ